MHFILIRHGTLFKWIFPSDKTHDATRKPEYDFECLCRGFTFCKTGLIMQEVPGENFHNGIFILHLQFHEYKLY